MLRISGVRKRFGGVTAVDGVSLELAPGEIFGLLGPNGAGKTTTISMAVGLLRPDEGRVELGDLGSPELASARAHIGLAPQALAVYDDLTGAENLEFFASLYGASRRDARARAAELLRLVGLEDRGGDRAGAYSGGMKRRLNLALALVHDPPLVLLDEPTVGVDPQSRAAIFEIITSLREAGRTILYTTHYMEEAQRLCDRVGIIDRGRLLALDTVDGLLDEHGARSAVTVETDAGRRRIESDDPLATLAGVLKDPETRGVHIERADLESVFLALTGRRLRD